MAHTKTPSEQQTKTRTSRNATSVGRLRAGMRALDRIAVRGQLGPSVGRRHDRGPERYL